MYYVGLSAQWGVNCVAVATSPVPGGPYTDQGPLSLDPSAIDLGPRGTVPGLPIGCGDRAGRGNIDPSWFIDPSSGDAYLYVSTNDSCTVDPSCPFTPTISVFALDPDLLHAAGLRVPLFGGSPGSWEAAGIATPTVEGPFMEVHNGVYYLFYSGGNYQSSYAMGYATGGGPEGPFVKSPANPILAPTPTVLSPGGGDQFVTGPHGGLWLVYHGRSGSLSALRTLRIDQVSWQAAATPGAPDLPAVAGPTATPQPVQP
jgi:beta-xylosidase